MTEKPPSPFTPGSPVPVELFVGRALEIQQLMRSIQQCVAGRHQNVFLLGERAVGKTSISSFLRYWASTQENVIGVHVFLGGVSSLPDLVRNVFESLLKTSHTQQWFHKVRSFFGSFVTDVGLFGVSVGFAPPRDDLEQLVRNFPQSLSNLIAELNEDIKGVLIVLDDLDAISEDPSFANWYKSFVDEAATHFSLFPVVVLLIGLPAIIDRLAEHQPSLPRIFNIIELHKLTNDEVSSFLTKAFAGVGIEVDADALSLMVNFASGVPVIMHEIGDATYWLVEKKRISREDALMGVLTAAERIGRKYLDPQVYRAIRSSSYRSILRKIGLRGTPLTRAFSRREIAERLTDKEKKVLDNFLRRLRQLGVIEPDRESGPGFYRFVNDIYPVYVFMEARTFGKEAKGAQAS